MPIDDYAALKDIPAADVLISGTHAATLTRGQRDTITFRYDPPQLKPAGPVRAHSVSWSLPAAVDATPVVTTAGAVPAFFAGLLPEGVRLGAVVASTKTSVDDHPRRRLPGPRPLSGCEVSTQDRAGDHRTRAGLC